MAKFEYMQSTFCSDLKPRARLVLQCLILHSNKEGTCFPSIKTIAAECGYGVTTVKRALDDLLEAGYIQKAPRFDERKNGGQTSNLYTLRAEMEKPAPSDGGEVPPREPEHYRADEATSCGDSPTPKDSCAQPFIYTFADGMKAVSRRAKKAASVMWAGGQPILIPP